MIEVVYMCSYVLDLICMMKGIQSTSSHQQSAMENISSVRSNWPVKASESICTEIEYFGLVAKCM